MRKHLDEAVTVTPPNDSWRLVVRRAFTDGLVRYDVGCTVPVEAFAKMRNHQRLLDGHYVQWTPPSDAKPRAPRAVAPAAPAPKPALEIVDDPDVVKSWRLTLAAAVLKVGNAQRAQDLIVDTVPGGADLYRLAARVWAARSAPSFGAVVRSVEGLNEGIAP